jgi:hypothetical protein
MFNRFNVSICSASFVPHLLFVLFVCLSKLSNYLFFCFLDFPPVNDIPGQHVDPSGQQLTRQTGRLSQKPKNALF